MPNFEGRLTLAEEQFDLPAAFVEFNYLVCRRIEIVGDDAQDFAGLGVHVEFVDRTEMD